MAKKTRRARRQVSINPPTTAEQAESNAVQPAVEARTRSTDSSRPALVTRAASNFREEYAYVISDLRRFIIMASVMLVILVGLAIILPLVGI